jgi:hypothetical protein
MASCKSSDAIQFNRHISEAQVGELVALADVELIELDLPHARSGFGGISLIGVGRFCDADLSRPSNPDGPGCSAFPSC